jgi:hypothetical protein
MTPRILILPMLLLPGCAAIPPLGLGGATPGATPPLLPASALPAPASTAAPNGTLTAEAAALQARANALRNP